MTKALANAALVVFSTLLVLGVVEIVFRALSIANPELDADAIWTTQEAFRVQDEYQPIVIGDTWFREPGLRPEILNAETRRVLFLGDSFTEGAGIAHSRDRFSDLIESRLNQEFGGNESRIEIHILNAGKGGSRPEDWKQYFFVLEPLYDPDFVFAIFFLRDGTSLSTSLKFNRDIIEPIEERYRSMPLRDHSALLRFFYNRLAWREYTKDFKQRMVSSYVGTSAEQEMWITQRRALLDLAMHCRRLGIPFHLVIFPMLYNLDDYEFFEVEELIETFAADHDIPVFSLTPGFLGEEDHTLWVASNDQHPNEKGHRIAAETLLPYVREVVREGR
jgi:lysophospholipase L1-like esterase